MTGLAFQDADVVFDYPPAMVDHGAVEVSSRGSGGYAGESMRTRPEDPSTSEIVLAAEPIGHNADAWAVYDSIKRVTDLLICLAIVPFVVPLAGLIALAVRVESPGPVIFRQTRVGRGGRAFQIFKFRTLRADHDQEQDRAYMEAFIRGRTNDLGEADEHVVNKPIQPSTVTRVGRFLRRSSLDELPQIVNVLNGEMSIVGPRPNVPWEVDAYLEWHRERLEATPGITGLAQVRGRSCLTFDGIAAADIEYVRRRSWLLDLKILWLTVVCLFSGDGAG